LKKILKIKVKYYIKKDKQVDYTIKEKKEPEFVEK
jgi:hypothetical protein